jgi:quinol-cytochrome oxidoreductase complex cytochrome b subunit
MARVIVLVIALVFIIGLAVLTLVGTAEHGFTLQGAVSVFVVAVLGVGIVGALLDRTRK